MPIRNSTKAIIIRDGKLLCIKCRFAHSYGELTYLLPGGGQNHGEPLADAMKREVFEETGAGVKVSELALVREFIDADSPWGDMHQVEFFFRCELLTEPDLSLATEPDESQEGLEWLPIAELHRYRIYPMKLKECIQPDGTVRGSVYIGNC